MTKLTFSTLAALCVGVAACGDPPQRLGTDAGLPLPACEHEPAPAVAVRLFAVGHRLSLAEAESAQAFRAALRATVERDVVLNLAGDRPNVLVFPESVTLPLVLLGASGVDAWRPAIAAATGGRIYVVWEDSRTGHAELRLAASKLPALE